MHHEAINFIKSYAIIKKIIKAIGLIAFCFFLFFSVHFLKIRQNIINTSYHAAKEKNKYIAQNISTFIDQLNPLVYELVKKIEQDNINHQAILEYIKKKPVEVSGFGVIFNSPWYAPYCVEYDDTQKIEELPSSVKTADWYMQALSSKKSFSGLFFDERSNQPIFYMVAPFYLDKNKISDPAGFVFATQSMAHIRHILSTFFTDQNGYCFLLDQQKTFLAHPENFWVRTKKTIIDLAKKVNNQAIITYAENAEKNNYAFMSYQNEMTDHLSWLFLNKIDSTGWLIASVVDKHELPLTHDFYRHNISIIIMSFIIMFFCALLLMPSLYKRPHHQLLWIISNAVALLFLLGIISFWILAVKFPSANDHNLTVKNKVELYNLLEKFEAVYNGIPDKESSNIPSENDFKKLLLYRYQNKNYVPTGIIINDAHFTKADEIEFVGFVWQRYFDGIHDSLNRGFILPQKSIKTNITEISRTKNANVEIIIWQVQARLNQSFNYKAFPFDPKNIKIQLLHKDFEKNIVLVPDLDAYKIINPAALPGIGQDTHLSGWNLLKSYFGYEIEHYLINFGLYDQGPFGIYDEVKLSEVPELSLNVKAQRDLMDIILTDLLTLCAIAIILFVLLLTYFPEGGLELVLEIAATALFSTVFAQIQFRSKILSHEFVYFEIFYFTLYLAIIFLLITTLIHMFKINVPLIRYHNNLITKLLYWPFILGVIWGVTIFYLY